MPLPAHLVTSSDVVSTGPDGLFSIHDDDGELVVSLRFTSDRAARRCAFVMVALAAELEQRADDEADAETELEERRRRLLESDEFIPMGEYVRRVAALFPPEHLEFRKMVDTVRQDARWTPGAGYLKGLPDVVLAALVADAAIEAAEQIVAEEGRA